MSEEQNKEKLEKEAQEKYMTLQLLDKQIKNVQVQIQSLEQQANELQTVRQNLEVFKTVKNGSEILLPLAQGIFAKAELKDNLNVAVNVGASTIVQKDIEQTQTMLEEQTKEVIGVQDKLMHQLQRFVHEAQKTENELRELLK